jgi:hypothetical protein
LKRCGDADIDRSLGAELELAPHALIELRDRRATRASEALTLGELALNLSLFACRGELERDELARVFEHYTLSAIDVSAVSTGGRRPPAKPAWAASSTTSRRERARNFHTKLSRATVRWGCSNPCREVAIVDAK